MSFVDISSLELLVELFEEQQEMVAGGVVYKEQYSYQEKYEKKTEESTKENKTADKPFWFSPLFMFDGLDELNGITSRIIGL
jgi:hypothetical protein